MSMAVGEEATLKTRNRLLSLLVELSTVRVNVCPYHLHWLTRIEKRYKWFCLCNLFRQLNTFPIGKDKVEVIHLCIKYYCLWDSFD